MVRKEIDEFLYSQWIGVLSMKDDEGAYGIPIPYYYDGKTMNFAMLIYLLDLMEEQFKKLIEGAKEGPQEAFSHYKKGLLLNPQESNLFKLHIKEITGRRFGV